MNLYKGNKKDNMLGSFRFVQENNVGMGKNNFDPITINGKEYCCGYIEPGFTKGGYESGNQRKMHIERIIGSAHGIGSIDSVLTMWCAKSPVVDRTVIVGWYKDATVYRKPLVLPYNSTTERGLPEFGYMYNVIADKKNCVLLPDNERNKKEWAAYRKSQNPQKYGFGQSNMWYANEEIAQEYIARIVNQVNNYSGHNLVNI